jgi:hypothetical protein
LAEITLSEDAERAMQDAENFCWKANVAILAAEHLLGGALMGLAKTCPGLPDQAAIEAAILAIHGAGDTTLENANIMWGSAARDALSSAAADLRRAGGSQLTAAAIALGVINSGEITPMFFSSLGTTKHALIEAIGA